MSIRFIKFDPMSRVMTLQDNHDSGSYPVGEAVSTAYVTVDNPFGNSKDGKYEIPNPVDVTNGKVFDIDSHKLEVTDEDESYLSFKEGVFDVNYYVGFAQIDVTGNEGDIYLTGNNLVPVASTYDSVIIEGEIYEIDKSKDTNAGQILFLQSPLKSDATEATVALRFVAKIYNDFRSKYIIARSAHILGNNYPNSVRNRLLEKENGVLKVIKNRIASKIFFEQGDYLKATRLLKENLEIGEWLQVIKGDILWY